MKRAMITGITGQDGSYLAELLLAKGSGGWTSPKEKEGALGSGCIIASAVMGRNG